MGTVTIRLISTDGDLEWAISRISNLMEAKPSTQDSDELEILVILVQNYESRHYPFPKASTTEVLKIMLEQHDLQLADIRPYFAPETHFQKVIEGNAKLTLDQVRLMCKLLGVSPTTLFD